MAKQYIPGSVRLARGIPDTRTGRDGGEGQVATWLRAAGPTPRLTAALRARGVPVAVATSSAQPVYELKTVRPRYSLTPGRSASLRKGRGLVVAPCGWLAGRRRNTRIVRLICRGDRRAGRGISPLAEVTVIGRSPGPAGKYDFRPSGQHDTERLEPSPQRWSTPRPESTKATRQLPRNWRRAALKRTRCRRSAGRRKWEAPRPHAAGSFREYRL
jgi:hypothetical protein